MSAAPVAIGLLSPCGWGNLGDAAIQEAMIRNVRARFPNARLTGITLNPADTTARHGIPAFPIAGRARPGRWVAPESPPAGGPPPPPPSPTGIRSALKRIPGLAPLVRASRAALAPLLSELRHIGASFRLLRSLDLLIISGGGQLDDTWGGAWGGPYDLCKWALLADAAGARVAVVSVGAESLSSALSRALARTALRIAAYRSYRDAASRRVVAALGLGERDTIVSDLAFSLPMPPVPSSGKTPPTVGVSPMAYCDPRVWPRKDTQVYHRYLELLAHMVRDLRAHGLRVLLFTTDTPDRRAVADLLRLLNDPGVCAPQVDSLDQLMGVLADVDLVVASRLHGVLLSLLAGRPVLALSYHRKVRDHMEEMDLAPYCLDIEEATAPALVAGFEALARDAAQLRPRIARAIAARQATLADQYDEVLALLGTRT